ncbi:CocE/NonD family hydrolase, partial [Kitasatospora sp. NPDC001574]
MPSYPYRTTREDLRVPLPDGTELFARVRRPVTDEPVPVVLEYSTGRLTDWTATEDARRHPWFAGHGYAAVRADARGHGNSGGLATSDPDDGAADGEELVRALAGQPAVGSSPRSSAFHRSAGLSAAALFRDTGA